MGSLLAVGPAFGFATGSIGDKANTYPDGSPQGQCIVFVAKVLKSVSAGSINISAYASGYQGTYRANGAAEVSSASAGRGDIIQVTPAGTSDSWTGPEGNRPLHTAVILKNLGGGSFSVVDSNYARTERVLHHNYNPYGAGKTVKIWRFGSGGGGGTGGGSGPTWFLKNSQSGGSADKSFIYGRAGDIPIVGDWNGDGVDTPGVVRSGVWYLRNSQTGGSADRVFGYGRAGDIPIVGDWNGDGIDTPGVVRNGIWYLKNSFSSGNADHTFSYGKATDVPIVGDWNGDGIDTPGVFRGGGWYLKNSQASGEADRSFIYGRAGDTPIVGDWNGDHIDTPGVWRAANWYLKNSQSGGNADKAFGYGREGDTPLVGDWNGDRISTPAVKR